MGINKEIIEIAKTWRSENGFTDMGGVVIIFNDDVNSWCAELRNPEHWNTGCIAVDENGNQWISTGGDSYNGAKAWKHITNV